MSTDGKELLESVKSGVDNLAAKMLNGQSQHFLDYLNFASRFHNYSLNNQFLIMMQKPKATRVAGYNTWKNLGRFAIAGTGIKILAPRFFSKQEKNKAGQLKEKQAMYFIGVTVFDVADTIGAELPTWVSDTPSDEKDASLLASLTEASSSWGYKVTVSSNMRDGINSGETQGYTTSDGEIVLKSGVAPRRSFLTLIHEVAHQLADHFDAKNREMLTKQDRELQAEAVAYVVANHFGIENVDSADYLLNYRVTPETLQANLNIINKVSKQIIEKLEGATTMVASEVAA